MTTMDKQYHENKIEQLVTDFSEALRAKLRASSEKYGYNDDWAKDGWEHSLSEQLLDHVIKGDPRDVAAYCAFAWYHGWSVKPSIELPDPHSKDVGWQVKKIDGVWCVGMNGNLDTRHDAVIKVNPGALGVSLEDMDDAAYKTARWVANMYNILNRCK